MRWHLLWCQRFFYYFCVMNDDERLRITEKTVELLKTVFALSLPGKEYIDVDDDAVVHIDMTLTAPNCPASDFIMEDIRLKIESIDGVSSVDLQLVFEPEWNADMMSEEAKLELGLL